MRIISEDLKHGTIQVNIQNLDDLWILYNVIKKDDLVYSRTTREVKTDEVSRPSSRRVSATFGLKVEKIYFDKDLVRLRIHGIVADAPDKFGILGSHHTFSLLEDSVVKIIKERWAKHELESMRKASKNEMPVIIVAIDNDECAIGISRMSGVDIKLEIKSHLPGKREAEKRDQALIKYFSVITEPLTRIHDTCEAKILIVGPGFTKEYFMKFLKNNNSKLIQEVVAIKSVSNGGAAGVYEAIRVGLVGNVMKGARTMNELKLVEEVLARLGASRGDVSYGIDEVYLDASSGAVETVLVCDEILRGAENQEQLSLEKTLRMIEENQGKVVIISMGHEGGRKLESLGGMAALLRYERHKQY
ncbi:mRNA surveillance protein pelota [[Eubacterium] cellulosolvens]